MRYNAYIIVQALWGLPQTLAGSAVCLAHRDCPRFRFHGAVVTVWDRTSQGLSLGPFVFVDSAQGKGQAEVTAAMRSPGNDELPVGVYRQLVVHEYGHTVQSLILGPLYLPVVGLPSVIWAKTPALVKSRRDNRKSYYSFGPERFANWLGERVLKQASMGQAIID